MGVCEGLGVVRLKLGFRAACVKVLCANRISELLIGQSCHLCKHGFSQPETFEALNSLALSFSLVSRILIFISHICFQAIGLRFS